MSESNDEARQEVSVIGQEPIRPFDPILETTRVDVFVVAGVADWTATVQRNLDNGSRVAVGVDRPIARRLLGSKGSDSLSGRQARRALMNLGVNVLESYVVWPSLDAPRLIYQYPVTGWWLHRAGIIGGGGRSSQRQRVARSRFVAPVVVLAYPSSIWVVTR